MYMCMGVSVSLWLCVSIGNIFVYVYMDVCVYSNIRKIATTKLGSSAAFY